MFSLFFFFKTGGDPHGTVNRMDQDGNPTETYLVDLAESFLCGFSNNMKTMKNNTTGMIDPNFITNNEILDWGILGASRKFAEEWNVHQQQSESEQARRTQQRGGMHAFHQGGHTAGADRGKLACLCLTLILKLYQTIPSIRAAMKRIRLNFRNKISQLLHLGKENGWNMWNDGTSEEPMYSCVEEENALGMISMLQLRYSWSWSVDWLKEISLQKFLGGNYRLQTRRHDLLLNIDILCELHTKFNQSMFKGMLGSGEDGEGEGEREGDDPLNTSFASSLNESMTENGCYITTLMDDLCGGNNTYEVTGCGSSFCNGIYHPGLKYWDSVPTWVMETTVDINDSTNGTVIKNKKMKFTMFRVLMSNAKKRNWYLSVMDELRPGKFLISFSSSSSSVFVFVLCFADLSVFNFFVCFLLLPPPPSSFLSLPLSFP